MKSILVFIRNLTLPVALALSFMAAPGLVSLTVSDAYAQKAKDKRKPNRKTRKAKVLSKKAFEALTAAQEAMELEDYATAAKFLDEILNAKRSSDYERALSLQTYAYIYSAREDYVQAARYFERTLATGGLEEGQARSALYNLAQLYLAIGNIDLGIRKLEEWFVGAENPTPDAYVLLANAYAQKEAYKRAIPLVEKAVSISDDPKERWYQLLMALYYEEKQYPEVAGVLEIMVSKWPAQKRYWMQLSAVYASLDNDAGSLSIMELAYKQGYLTESKELVNLAQMYLYREVPIRAALVMQKGFGDEQIEETEDNWALYANSLIQSEEITEALEPLYEAAALSEEGDLYVRLAQAHFADEDWAKAIGALGKAFKKGKLDNPGRGYLLLGVANYNLKRFKGAIKAFSNARKYAKTKKDASQWLRHVKREQDKS